MQDQTRRQDEEDIQLELRLRLRSRRNRTYGDERTAWRFPGACTSTPDGPSPHAPIPFSHQARLCLVCQFLPFDRTLKPADSLPPVRCFVPFFCSVQLFTWHQKQAEPPPPPFTLASIASASFSSLLPFSTLLHSRKSSLIVGR